MCKKCDKDVLLNDLLKIKERLEDSSKHHLLMLPSREALRLMSYEDLYNVAALLQWDAGEIESDLSSTMNRIDSHPDMVGDELPALFPNSDGDDRMGVAWYAVCFNRNCSFSSDNPEMLTKVGAHYYCDAHVPDSEESHTDGLW
jgi:hypothetical protein